MVQMITIVIAYSFFALRSSCGCEQITQQKLPKLCYLNLKYY